MGEVTDEQLNGIGKLLVLEGDHDLSNDDIQRITRASRVQEFATEDSVEPLDEFMCRIVSRWLEAEGISEHAQDFKAYSVQGGEATSHLLEVQTNQVLLAIEIGAATAKELHNATVLKCELLALQEWLSRILTRNTALVSMLSKCRIASPLTDASEHLRAAHEDYGSRELDEVDRMITAVTMHRW
jgi:hypothetical protein